MNNVGRELVRYIGRIWLDGYAKLVEQLPAITNLIPFANSLHIYARDKGNVSALFYRDDAGVEHDLSLSPITPPTMQVAEETHTDTFDLMAFSSPTPAFTTTQPPVFPVSWTEDPGDTFQQSHFTTYDEDNVFITPADSSSLKNLHDYRKVTGSPGIVSGGALSNGAAGTVNIAAGVAIFRVTDSDSAELDCHDFGPFTNVAIPSNTNRFIYIDYNGGSPTTFLSTDRAIHDQTKIQIGSAANEGGTITDRVDLSQNLPGGIYWAEHYLRHVFGIVRAGGAGLILSSTGTRNLAVTAGELHYGRNLFEISAFNTAVSGTFDRYYRDGGGGWTKVAAQTTWADIPAQWDNNSGILQAVPSGRFLSSWIYQELDGHVVMLYPQVLTSTLANELLSTPPASVPPRLDAEGMLIGRIIYKWNGSDDLLQEVQTVFTTTFSAAVTASHADLSNLAWNISGHTGTASTLASFDGAGAATFTTPANVTAASSKITLAGTPTGAALSAFSIDVNQANLDHGSIGGLSDDDHTQYALLAGRSGGQTLKGDTASAGDLTLQSTSHSTRGTVKIVDLLDSNTERSLLIGSNGLTDRPILLEVGGVWSTTGTNCAAFTVSTEFTGAAGGTVQGINAYPVFTPPSGNMEGAAALCIAQANPASGATMPNMYGALYRTDFKSAAGAVTNGIPLKVLSPFFYGTLKPSNQYGLMIDNQGASGISNTVGIYLAAQSGSSSNYDMGFGTVNTAAAGAYYGKIPVFYNGLLKYLHVFS